MTDPAASTRRSTPTWARAILLVALFVALLLPWTGRLKSPALVADDVARVIDLQTLTLAERLVRPFNEHLAPLFELVTAAAWELAGRRLGSTPMAFVLASYLPFVLSLLMLWVLIRREWGSPTAAGLAVTLFAASPMYAECVFWFSASTFTWALLATLVAAWMAGLASDRRSIGFAVGSAVACLIAPMGSAIGLLAGPVASIRCLPERRPRWPFRAEAFAIIPALGTIANLAIASCFKYQDVLAKSVHTYREVSIGLAKVVEAPLCLVLGGYFRVAEPHRLVPSWASATFFAIGVILVAVVGWQRPASDRRWLAIGATLIGLGYAMIYGFRTRQVGIDSMLAIQRYHLFPCLGLALIVTAWLAPRLRRLDARPVLGATLVLGLAVLLVGINRPMMKSRLGYFRMHPDQAATLAMMDHLSDVARSRELTREQLLRAFDPLEPRWTAAGWNVMRMLPRTPIDGRASGLPDDEVRDVVAGALPLVDLPLLLADRNVTRWLEARPFSTSQTPGQLVATLRIHPTGAPDEYLCDGWPSYLEFAYEPAEGVPLGIGLAGLPAGKTVEVSWDDGGGAWLTARRSVVRIETPTLKRPDLVLPFDRLPILDASKLRRVRIAIREAGPVAISVPSLVR